MTGNIHIINMKRKRNDKKKKRNDKRKKKNVKIINCITRNKSVF